MAIKKNTKKVAPKKSVAKTLPVKKQVEKKAVKVSKNKLTITPVSYEEKAYAAYFGDKWAWYKNADEKYTTKRGIVWSWWAFFFSIFYLMVRKFYFPAFAMLVLSLLSYFSIAFVNPYSNLVYNLLWAMFMAVSLPYLVLSNYKRTKERIELTETNETKRLEVLSKKGGKNKFFIVFTVTLLVLYAVWVGYIVSSAVSYYKYIQEQQLNSSALVQTDTDVE